MSDESHQSSIEQIAAILLAHEVEFLVIGGQAEYLFGSSRVTFDVDLCYSRKRENLQRLANALEEMDVRLRGVPDDVPFVMDARSLEFGCNFTFKTRFGDLDILGYVEPLGEFDRLLRSHEAYEVGPLLLRTISLEDLLQVKRHINRPKDQESIAQLLAIQRIRAEGGAR